MRLCNTSEETMADCINQREKQQVERDWGHFRTYKIRRLRALRTEKEADLLIRN